MDDDCDDKDDTKRRTRNLSEKKRRDQFNMLVNELSTMITTNNRKMDKSTVLKSTITFLKNHNEITVRSRAHDVQENWKPALLPNDEFTYLILEALEGFVMVFSAMSLRIYYVSESITSLLGHKPADVVNKTLFDFASEEDKANLYSLLQSPETAGTSTQTQVKENEIRFQCYLRRGILDFREVTYELIEFSGHFRTNLEQVKSDNTSGYQRDHDSRALFVCTGRLYTPQLNRDVSLLDLNRSEFTSRHSLEWKFLFLDHRAPPIIGYLPFEVLGTSGYDYYHFDDLEKVVTCHQALMRKGELTSDYYRFLTKGQQWIWLQTRFYITYHQWNAKPEFVVCTHRVVNYADIANSMKQENTENTETAYQEMETNQTIVKEQPAEDTMSSLSPSYLSEGGDGFRNTSYQSLSKPASVKSVSASSTTSTVTTMLTSAPSGASWPRAPHVRYATASDTASVSGESLSSQQQNASRDVNQMSNAFGLVSNDENVMMYSGGKCNEALVPQHGIGAQYLEPEPYAAASGVPPLPVIVSPDQVQLQEQLQRKHEQLQQMIVRQQEELRQVKEQLLLARLGMLQPLIDVQSPYVNQAEMQQEQHLPQQAVYQAGSHASLTGHAPSMPPSHTTSPHHPHMPQ